MSIEFFLAEEGDRKLARRLKKAEARISRLEAGLQKTQELLVYVVGMVDPKWSAEADALLAKHAARPVGGEKKGGKT